MKIYDKDGQPIPVAEEHWFKKPTFGICDEQQTKHLVDLTWLKGKFPQVRRVVFNVTPTHSIDIAL